MKIFQLQDPSVENICFIRSVHDTLTLDNNFNEFIAKGGPIIFISIPRFQNGVPVTLGYVTEKVCAEGNPIIAPYPNWEWNRLGQCDALTSVFRMQVRIENFVFMSCKFGLIRAHNILFTYCAR